MNKIIRRLVSFNVTLLLVFSFCLVVHAWTPPKLKNPYVEPDVQFRSVWVCTVSNMDIKKQNGTDDAAIETWKNAYLQILENSVKNGMNAIIFQVSPCNDAFYPSKYRPWSEYLAGFGVDPGWDPVEWMIEVTHAAGLEYHAWFNPYRTSTSALAQSITLEDAATGAHYIYDYNTEDLYKYKQTYFGNLKNTCEKNNTLVDNPIFLTGDELDYNVVYGAEGKFVLNPAAPKTIENVQNTIEEFITNYDADGVHFDDYFYPDDKNFKGSNAEYKKYTFSTEPNIDYNDYMNYVKTGGSLTIYDWRRENVNTLIKSLSDIIRENNLTDNYKCAFGISPAARWAPSIESCPAGSYRAAEGGMDESCNNYYSYSDLFADTKKWAVEGWLDYILPQVYTYLGDTPSGVPDGTYPTITKWWSDTLKGYDCKLYIGTALYQISSWNKAQYATSDEFFYQQKYNQDKNFRVDGYVMFRYDSMLSTLGAKCMTKILDNVWKVTALTPTYPSYVYDSVDQAATINSIKLNADGSYTAYFDQIEDAKAYGILDGDTCVSRVLSGASSITFNKEEGKTYTFVTYGYDNQMHANKETVNLDNVIENQKPTITFNSKFEKEYLVASKIDLEFQIVDPENDPVTYSLYIYTDGTKRNLVVDQKLTNSVVTYSYTCYQIEFKNCYFVVEVNDGFGPVELNGDVFDIVTEYTPTTPPHTHNFIEGVCECGESDPNYIAPTPDKKKCGKKSAELVVAAISVAMTIGIILRKKD